ncbi:glyoxylate/hydroxypyruvate reductase A [Bordetella genomosp. 10]|uniref:Glyoxylate/hydroxypyruvate reductase A n=1 Tax=Bordetella genomosp. 10 TaxID=1416804 RepID=A0A261RZ02_9BORD|nr:glyoxylate/hydroxypyruvate reductase A [Bordetella genomosp. 10]OZI30324.1 glyoxylate/hydroxypyruvate reductase A [Bordetella genomosp. 10]
MSSTLPSSPGAAAARPRIALLSSKIDMAYLVPAFAEVYPQAELVLDPGPGDRESIVAAVCWAPRHGELAALPNLRLIQSIGAGIDHIASDPDLPDVPLCRIVDDDMGAGMAAYVCWAVTHRQRHMQDYADSAAAGRWEEQPIVSPRDHRVGIAGMGELGARCALALRAIGYAVRGWSRGPKTGLPADIALFHGDAQRGDFLAGCDTLVCLLPATPETFGMFDARLFARLPRGAHFVNVGRGAHVVEDDLLRALDDGALGYATLDTFIQEPLPPDHRFWRHPRVRVTPHIATRTSATAIARQTRDNLEAVLQGRAGDVAVTPGKGY